MMWIQRLFLIALMSFSAPAIGEGDKEAHASFLKEVDAQATEARRLFAKASYCVTYTLKTAEGRQSVLDPTHVINAEELRKRTDLEQKLTPEMGQTVIEAALNRKGWHPIRDCYEPHHVFVFYSAEAKPVAAVELCLTCNRIRITPSEVNTRDLYSSFETADLDVLAEVLHAVGLPLTPFKSLTEYRDRSAGGHEDLK